MSKPLDLAELYRTDPVKACQLALRRTAGIDWRERLEACNAALDGHGTEAIHGEWQNGYWCDVVAAYVNFGDTYDITIIHERGEPGWSHGRFIVGSWGDWLEANGERLGVGAQ